MAPQADSPAPVPLVDVPRHVRPCRWLPCHRIGYDPLDPALPVEMVCDRGSVPLEAVILFLLQAVVISLSGVMAPGPMTAAALAAGTRSRHAGARIALGHGVVEFPLMILIMAGTGALLALEHVRIGIGLAGGAVLVFMGLQMLHGLRRAAETTGQHAGRNAVWTGSGGLPLG
jgi:hypothetical protein